MLSLAEAYTLSTAGNMLQKHGFISELGMNELKSATLF